ncbi:MAG: rhomboid family intramembrane serine protease [Halieaceae bacterium]|nr:rhomboid family intramembrane serine protease [Halieaceae bacterium]
MGEFAFSDQTGVGASGVVYAIFGYLWIARFTKAEYRQVIDDRTIRLLIGWLFLCIPLTLLDLLPVANAAHFGGILFGMGAAELFAVRRRRPLIAVGLLLLFTLPSITLLWCPWSPSWLSARALEG